MAKYKVGNKVLVKNIKEPGRYSMEDSECWNSFVVGMLQYSGKAVTINGYRNGQYTIKEDGGHWLWVDGMFEGLAESPKIVITSDGKTVMARLFNGKELVDKAEAKCSTDDKYDFMVGAKLAMERLTEKPNEPKYKVGQYVKIIGNKWYGHGLAMGSYGRIRKVESGDVYEIDGFDHNGTLNQSLHPDDFELA